MISTRTWVLHLQRTRLDTAECNTVFFAFFRSSTTSRSMTLHAPKATLTFSIIYSFEKNGKRFGIFFSLLTQTAYMGLIFIRTVVIFIATLLVMRLMGKRQIGEMQPYELVITLIIADLACIPMADNSIPLLYGIIAIVSVYFLHQILCLIDLNFVKAKSVISGTPSIVLNKNGIDDTQLKKNNLDISDLIESLRIEGYFSLDAVDYALYESSGTFSALPKKDYEDKQISLPIIIIDEGKWQEENVQKTQRDIPYFWNILRGQGCVELKKVLVMTVDGNGKLYLQIKGQKYKTMQLPWQTALW